MRSRRAIVGFALALATALGVGACGGATKTRVTKPVPSVTCLALTRTALVTGRPRKLGSKAASFGEIIVDPKTGLWRIPGGTEICGSQVPFKLPAGKIATFQAAFRPASGRISLHAYGLALFTDASAGGTSYNNGYTIMFEAPSRAVVYRRDSGSFNNISDAYPNRVPMTDGRWHTLKVVVTHTSNSQMDFAGYVDGVPAFTGHDSASLYTSGIWGPVNRSFYSGESVNPNSFSVTVSAAP